MLFSRPFHQAMDPLDEEEDDPKDNRDNPTAKKYGTSVADE